MLTLNATSEGSITATLGRCRRRGGAVGDAPAESAVRPWQRALPRAGRARPGRRCGGRTAGVGNISLVSYTPNGQAAHVYARTLPNVAYRAAKGRMDLGRDRWHTYAVEVTREADLVVHRRPRRLHRDARRTVLSGVPLTVRFTMEAKPDRVMNISRMQMDWVRHWSLEAPNLQPVDAPPTRVGAYDKAC